MPIVTALYAGLLGLLAVAVAFPLAIHSLGAALVIARLLHAIGLKPDTVQSVGRGLGAMATALITVTASVWLLVVFVRRSP